MGLAVLTSFFSSLLFFNLIPNNLASFRAPRRVANALNSFISDVMGATTTASPTVGLTLRPFSWLAFISFTSALDASPFLTFLVPLRLGKTTNLDLYSLSRSTFDCKDSSLLFVRLWSTAMPIVCARFLLMPATFSSSSVKPRPSFNLELYCVSSCHTHS